MRPIFTALACLLLCTAFLLGCKEECDSSCEMRKEFELSPTRIDFGYIDEGPRPKPMHPSLLYYGSGRPRERYPKRPKRPFNVSMTRTEAGVLVKLKNEASIVFNMKEWLDFVRDLYIGIAEAKHGRATSLPLVPDRKIDILEIKIYSSNKAEPKEYYKFYHEEYTIKIRGVIRVMEDKIARIIEFKKKAEDNQNE